MNGDDMIFQMFSDESGFPSERFQSISIVSGKSTICNNLREKLSEILSSAGISESKWVKLNGHRPRMDVASEFIDIALEYARREKIRIDVLYWDIEDSRHAVIGRDDKANLERMYYKVIKHLINCWKQPTAIWELFPDKGSNLDWNQISNYLNSTRLNVPIPSIPLLEFFERDEVFHRYGAERQHVESRISIAKVLPVESHEEPLTQLADLFAGIARFSKEKGEEYFKWLLSEEGKNQKKLFFVENESGIIESKKTTARFTILRKLDRICKRYRMQVSLKTHRHLITKNPLKPINFWFYAPQVEEDKAPVKKELIT